MEHKAQHSKHFDIFMTYEEDSSPVGLAIPCSPYELSTTALSIARNAGIGDSAAILRDMLMGRWSKHYTRAKILQSVVIAHRKA